MALRALNDVVVDDEVMNRFLRPPNHHPYMPGIPIVLESCRSVTVPAKVLEAQELHLSHPLAHLFESQEDVPAPSRVVRLPELKKGDLSLRAGTYLYRHSKFLFEEGREEYPTTLRWIEHNGPTVMTREVRSIGDRLMEYCADVRGYTDGSVQVINTGPSPMCVCLHRPSRELLECISSSLEKRTTVGLDVVKSVTLRGFVRNLIEFLRSPPGSEFD